MKTLCSLLGITALVVLSACGGGGRGGDGGSGGGGAHCRLEALGDCYCNDTRTYDGGMSQCTPASVGGRAICCQDGTECSCLPKSCGIDSTGNCLCGSLLPPLTGGMTSCTGTASECCTQDTGYCYCEDGCHMRFGNRVVPSCDITTDTIVCLGGGTEVTSCE